MKKACLLAAAAALLAGGAHAAYKCVDEHGETHIGDTPPRACANVVMYEIKPSGTIVRRIDPTPTADQLRARREAEARQKELDKAAAEQRRLDMALLNTYASEPEFDVARDRNIEPLKARIASAQDRIAAAKKREKEIGDEMEFYTSGKSKHNRAQPDPVPGALASDLQRVRSEQAALNTSIAESEREIAQLRAKFEADKKRWIELKSGTAGADYAKGDARPAANAPLKR
jgi:hypothetical protein